MNLRNILTIFTLLLMLVAIFPTLQIEVIASSPSEADSIEGSSASSFVADELDTLNGKHVYGSSMFIGDADIYVPKNYTTIQEAVDAANPGDTIFVEAGVYNENVDVDKTLNIIGAGQSFAIVNASDPNDHVFHITANYVNTTGFTVMGASGSGKAGIKLESVSNNDVSDNYVTGNYHGIFLDPSSNNTMTENTLIGNSYGFFLESSSGNFVYYNNIIDNMQQAFDDGANKWDDGYPYGGNYWSDWVFTDNYTGVNQNVAGDDFLVDHPYVIPNGTNQDRYPYAIQDGWTLFNHGVLLVGFKPDVPPETINSTIAEYGTEVIEYFDLIDIYFLRINVSDRGESETAYLFEGDPNVDFAVLDFYTPSKTHLTHPNDPTYPKQWGLNNFGRNPGLPLGVIDADIDAPQAWEHTTDCSDIVVAVIDSGVDLGHPDLVNNLWTNTLDPAGDADGDGDPDDDGNGIVDDIHGAEFRIAYRARTLELYVARDGTPDDSMFAPIPGHGTHVSGIIGAEGNNGIGVSGVNWRASIMAVKTVGGSKREDAFLSVFAAAIQYILRMKARGVNVRVINYSNGISRWDLTRARTVPPTRAYLDSARRAERILPRIGQSYARQMRALDAQGILFVCAAGYDVVDIDGPDPDGISPTGVTDYPGKLPAANIICVTASDNRDDFAGWANWGSVSVDLAAPGEDILSLIIRGLYRYTDSDGDNWVSPGDRRRSRVPRRDGEADYPVDSVVAAGDDDVGFDLVPFNHPWLGAVTTSLLSYMTGTSMATPFVSGAVAHFWSLFPWLGHLDVKDWILDIDRVDSRPGIRGGAPPAGVDRVVSGINHDGRLRMICGDDFGDAPDPFTNPGFYPTKRRYLGASHEDMGEEWLGFYGDVSPEFDADVNFPWDADPDFLPNILPGRIPPTPEPPYIPGDTPDLELYDDGVWLMTPFIPCQNATIVYSIMTENEDIVDFEGGRYLPGRITTLAPDKSLHMNIWIDWNQDGDWDDMGEHVYYERHNPTLEWNGTHCSGWKLVTFHVPWDAALGETWLRARLDYGENVGRRALYDSDGSLWDTYGLAQFGEVEDYILYVERCRKRPPTEWAMFGCDPTRAGYTISAGPNTNNSLWTYTTGGAIYSSPAVAEGKVFVGSSDRNIYAIDAETGMLVWNYTTGHWIDSSPAVMDGRVFVGSWDGSLYALDANSGEFLWKYATGDAIISSPAVAEGRVFVGSSDGNLYAISAETGTLVWRYMVGDWIDSSPAVVYGKVFFGSWDGFVYALDAETGNQVWRYNTGDAIVSSPAVVDGKLYIGSMNGKIYRLDAESGGLEWSYTSAGPIKGSPAVTCGKVFIGSYDGNVYALNAETGGLVWKSTIGVPFYSSPAVACKRKVFIASLSEEPNLPPTYSFADPAEDLIYIYTGEPVSPEMYLAHLDVIESTIELVDETLEFSITVNGGIPPLEHTTFWTVLMDRNNIPEDNSQYYPTNDVDTMYSIIYDATTEEWKMERAIYEPWGWDVTPTEATWSMISAYPNGHVIMQISIPLWELTELLPSRIPWKVQTETFNGIGDMAPNQGLAYLSLKHAKVYSLDAETGTILWTYETEDQMHSSSAIANSTLFIGSLDGKLYAFRSLHDVTITNAVPLKTIVGEGYTLKINATVENKGDFEETLDIVAIANSTLIDTEIISMALHSGSSATVTLNWDTTGWAKGSYAIDVYVLPVPYEYESMKDNICYGGVIAIATAGDVDYNKKVNILDIARLASAYGFEAGHPRYEPNLDINCDGIINIKDIAIAAKNFGKTES